MIGVVVALVVLGAAAYESMKSSSTGIASTPLGTDGRFVLRNGRAAYSIAGAAAMLADLQHYGLGPPTDPTGRGALVQLQDGQVSATSTIALMKTLQKTDCWIAPEGPSELWFRSPGNPPPADSGFLLLIGANDPWPPGAPLA